MRPLFVLALLLTLTLLVLWARSVWIVDSWSLQRTWIIENDTVVTEYAGFSSANGSFHASWGRAETIPAICVKPTPRDAAPWVFGHSSVGATPPPFDATRPWWQRIGFYREGTLYGGAFSIPAWFALASPIVATWVIFRGPLRGRHGSRLARGACLACGYDLRGAAHERCPECGQVVSSASHGEPSPLSKMK